jgi:hypothetical protein
MLTFEVIDRFRAVEFVVQAIEDRLFPQGDAAQAAKNQYILARIWRNRHERDEVTLIIKWLFFETSRDAHLPRYAASGARVYHDSVCSASAL